MKKQRFTESQIMQILKQAEEGVPVADLCREHGMSSASFYKWRSKYGGMDAALLSEMKALAEENKRLKRMYAEGGAWKKVAKPSQRKVIVQWVVQNKSVSIGLACATFGISETCYRYRRVLNARTRKSPTGGCYG